ncbi:MAG: hypothetical protein HOE90_08135 [Bacteriovoracaceae bacterium]|jgi:hypothetical protein|nr:hypothetical protein [Bacteriovoracaceae bacterium]
MDVKRKPKFLNERGQAVFEFIFFLPFFIHLFVALLSITESINGSINQQKAVRGYYFARIKGSSTIPRPHILAELNSVTRIGMSYIGWNIKNVGDSPYAPCYGVPSFGNQLDNEGCDDKYNVTEETTQFIRVKTAFGVCGKTYDNRSNGFSPSSLTGDYSSCNSI